MSATETAWPPVRGAPVPPEEPEQVDITIDVVRVLLASPRDWGQGRTEDKLTEARWMENLLAAIHETWGMAVILHDGCPTGGSRIIEEFWAGALGQPTEIYRPDWENCSPGCPTDEPEHRKPRKASDKVHGTADTYCYTADERMVKRLVHPESSKRPHRVIAVVTDYSRVTRKVTRLADEVGLPTKRYAPRWHGDEFRSN